jgi:tRNA threonylcarbamoyladenosine biosynthesis protein TsaB
VARARPSHPNASRVATPQWASRAVGVEGAVVHRRAGDGPLRLRGVGQPGRQRRVPPGEDLAGTAGADLVAQRLEAVIALPLRGLELAGGRLEPRDAEGRGAGIEGHDPRGLSGVERRLLHLRAGGDDADDLALDDALRRARVLHLLAQRDAVALPHELRDVGVRGMPGDAAHRNGVAVAVPGPGGEGDLERLRRHEGVLEEELVEVPHAEEEERVRVLRLHAVVLLHGRRLHGSGRRHEGTWSISYPVRVLALDTTTPRGSLAVADDEGVLAEARVLTGVGHSRWVLGAADALLQGLGIAPASIDGFAVTVGPGSFTGLRVGISTIQGLAIAAARPCVGVSALDVLALAAGVAAGGAERIVALMDAFRGETYAGVYDRDGRPVGPARVGRLEELVGEAGADGRPTAYVGDAAVTQRDAIRVVDPAGLFPEVELFLAAPLARAAIARLAAGRGEPAAALRPLYLRGADIRPARP